MKKHQSPSIFGNLRWGALQIAGLYLLIGFLWILFSDEIAARIASNQKMLTTISLYKGWGYILVTALMLYWLIRRHTSALRASEQQLQRVIDAVPAFIAYVDAKQRYQFANSSYEEWFDEKVQGKHIEEVIGKAAYKFIAKHIDKVLAGETVSYEAELPIQGQELFVNAKYVPDIAANGQVKGFFALIQDVTESKQAKEEVRLWANAFEGCAHGIAIGDPNTNRIVVCNPGFASLHKTRVEDIVGSAILSLYAPADQEYVRRNIQRADQIGHSRFEARMMRRDSSLFPVQMDVVSVLGEDGELLYRVATAQDISERKAMDEKLKESEAKYRTLVESLPAITYISEPGQYIGVSYISPQIETLGFARSTWLADPQFWFRQIHPEDQEQVISKLKQFETGDAPFRAEYRLRLPNGELRWFHDESIRVKDQDGKTILKQGIMMDITDRKHAEDKILQQARLLAQVNDAVIATDKDLILTMWNPTAERIYGWKAEEVIGKKAEEVLKTEFYNKTRSKAIQELHEEDEFSAEVTQLRKDGIKIQIEARTVATYDDHGTITGYVSINRDITERKKAEEKFKKSEERYRYLFENNPYPMWIYDRKTLMFLDVNEAAIAKYGYSRQEFLNMNIVDIRPLEDVERLMENLAQPREPLERSEGWRHRLKDGTLIDVEITSHTIDIEGHASALVMAQDITERKQAEEALRRSEALLLQTGEMAKVGGWELDLQTMNLVWSRETYRIHEVDSSFKPDVEHAINYYAPEARPVIAEAVQQAIENGKPFDLELPLITAKGKRIWVRAMGEAESRDGRMVRLFGTFQDITERRQGEENLRRFELLSEHSRDIILFIGHEDGDILEANIAAIQAYGYSREELLKLTIHDLRAENTRGLTTEQMAQADAGGILFESAHRRKDGTTFPVEVSSQGATIGDVRTLISIVRDITERKRAKEALELKDELLRLTSEMAKVGGWEFNTQTLKGTWTDEVARIHDLDPSTQTSVELGLSFYVGESRQKIEQAVQEAIELGKPYDLELKMVSAKGIHKWVRTMALPIMENSRAIKVQGIFQDITERKQAEEEIHRLNEELEQRVLERTAQLESANKELEAFSYSVSHDLRAPLRAIDGYTRILEEDYEPILDEEGKRVCGIISAEARRMGQLIDDLLAFSRLGRKQMYTAKIDMQAMAVSVFDELVKDKERQRIDFQISKLHPIKADPSLIRQVWINLLSNAIKFTSKKERAIIEVGNKQTPEENIYYVHDNGAGFDMEYANKLFGVFQRLHSESEFDGTGVGLAIVQRIVRRHGGRVWAKGELEKGATFYFALPRKENQS